MKVQAIIFDMDGVLVDSEPLYRKKVYDFYQRHHRNVSLQELSILAGCSHQCAMELMRDLFNQTMSVAEFEQFYYTHTKSLEFSYEDIINPYIRYILPRLKQLGLQLAIASSSPKKDIERFMSECKVTRYFDLSVTGRDFKESKPNPEIYLHTIDELKVDKASCVVVEDSTYGIAAGKNAGLFVAAHKDDRFGYDQTKADLSFGDFLEFYEWILEQQRI